jgi:hypothetical protein
VWESSLASVTERCNDGGCVARLFRDESESDVSACVVVVVVSSLVSDEDMCVSPSTKDNTTPLNSTCVSDM